MLFTIYSWCCEHCAWCVLQRWDVPHGVQQAGYLQSECAAEILYSLHELSARVQQHVICLSFNLLLLLFIIMGFFFGSLTRATSRHGKFVNMPEKLSAWIYIFCVKFFWYILLVNMLRSAVWCSFLPSLVTQQHIQDIHSNLFFDCNLWASVKPAAVLNSN